MMKFTRNIAVSGLVAAICAVAFSANAQSTQVGPKEFPPVTYKGKQYVDSAGCIFIRAGVDDAVRWVPRVTRERKQVCGATPTFATQTTPKAPATTAQAPVVIAASATSSAPATKAARKNPAPVSRPVVVPVGLVVTPDDAAAKGVGQNVRVVPKHVYEKRRNTTNVKVPKGYRSVWKDDRLNPHRAEQTLAGRQKMLSIWTNTSPQRLRD
jgi:hypothetical protein